MRKRGKLAQWAHERSVSLAFTTAILVFLSGVAGLFLVSGYYDGNRALTFGIISDSENIVTFKDIEIRLEHLADLIMEKKSVTSLLVAMLIFIGSIIGAFISAAKVGAYLDELKGKSFILLTKKNYEEKREALISERRSAAKTIATVIGSIAVGVAANYVFYHLVKIGMFL